MARRGIGQIYGSEGHFGKEPFYEVRLAKSAAEEMQQILAPTVGRRIGVTLTSDQYDRNRLRFSEVDPPAFEAVASEHYVRGNTLRISGDTSCNIDLSARFGVPALLGQLEEAKVAAREFVLLRVPNRARDLIELIPDTALGSDHPELAKIGAELAAEVWPQDDFSDWEKAEQNGNAND